ncbi:MAG: LysM peptidoglycan-binding domain-containing protein [Bacteroidota bacterium]|nr:LysM peptidoglycan-binding domain-containing protein [Bacteroidota bacterium]
MGIVKKIAFFFLLVFFCPIWAQTTTDTLLVKGQMYIKHIVKPSETYKSIAVHYKINVEELKLHNRNSKLYYKQSLLIPIRSTLAERLLYKDKKSNQSFLSNPKKVNSSSQFGKRDTLNIALLLPFYSTKNDSLLSFLSESDQDKEGIHKDSYMALDYLEGVIVATDSLTRAGMNINLFVYDTENDTVKVQQIIESGALKDADLIFGPVFTKNLRMITRVYGKNKEKTIVSPLSRNSSILKDGVNIFQIIPPFSIQMGKISAYVSRKHKKEKILILAQQKEKDRAKNYKNYFRTKKRKSKLCLFDGLHTITRDTVCKFLSNHKYVVLVPSADRSFVSKLIPILGTIDTTMTVFGLHNWASYENLDIATLMKLNVHFPHPYFFDNSQKENQRFKTVFANKFNTLPSKYAYIAFRQCIHFCTNKGEYSFKKHYTKGGFVNTDFPIVRYTDFEIQQVD